MSKVKPEIIKVYTDIDNGIELRLVKTVRGFVVGVWDTDCNEPFDGIKIFTGDDNEKKSKDYFNHIKSNKKMGSVLI